MIKNTNIPVLDSLRAYAALVVCLFHFVCTTVGYVKTDWILSAFSVGQYGVQTFFVISGFVIPWAMHHAGYELKNFFSFFLKRISRLEPPYIFSLILALLILFLREKYLGRDNAHMIVSVKQVFLHLGYLIPFFEDYKWLNQVYWTLAIEFQYYFFIALVFVPLMKVSAYVRYMIFAFTLALSYLGSDSFLLYWLPVFMLGIVLFLYKSEKIERTEYLLITLATVSLCLYKYPLAAVVFSLIPVVALLFFENVKIAGLHFVGKFSYSIYLVHPLLGGSLINILSHKYNTNMISKLMVIGSGMLLTLIGAWLTYLLIEKPAKRLSSSIKYKQANTNNGN